MFGCGGGGAYNGPFYSKYMIFLNFSEESIWYPAYNLNLSIQKAKAGGLLLVQEQPGVYSKEDLIEKE